MVFRQNERFGLADMKLLVNVSGSTLVLAIVLHTEIRGLKDPSRSKSSS